MVEGMVGIGHAVLYFKKPDSIVGDIKDDCEIFTSTAEIVSALNDLCRPDLLGEYVAVLVNFSGEGSIIAAYGCKSCPDLDDAVAEPIEQGIAPITNEYGVPTSIVMSVETPALSMEVK